MASLVSLLSNDILNLCIVINYLCIQAWFSLVYKTKEATQSLLSCLSISRREIGFETRGRRKIRGVVHGGLTGRQVIKPELQDGVFDKGGFMEIETLTTPIPGDFDPKNLTELPQISEVILRSQRAFKFRDHSRSAATDHVSHPAAAAAVAAAWYIYNMYCLLKVELTFNHSGPWTELFPTIMSPPIHSLNR